MLGIFEKLRYLVFALMITQEVRGSVILNHKDGYYNHPDLLSIFTLKKNKWEDGTPITVFIKPLDSIEHKLFVIGWLHISLTSYKMSIENAFYEKGDKYWLSVVKTDEEMYNSVLCTPNSIGYLDNLDLVKKDKFLTIIEQ